MVGFGNRGVIADNDPIEQEIDPEDLAHVSPYLTEHINRFGEYSTYELGIQSEAYDPKPDVDFTPLREQGLITADLGQAA